MTESNWKKWTQARIALGRRGSSVPTAQYLEILEAQALARDSLWRHWNTKALMDFLRSQKIPHFLAQTPVSDRQQYLKRPDLGRCLTDESYADLTNRKGHWNSEIVFCVTDGLATDAIDKQLIPFLQCFLPALYQESFYGDKPYPFVIVPFARVAAADLVATAMKSRISVIFVGERPGLSAHDSMGIYLTYGPNRGTPDSRRNCISNVRSPSGLSYDIATRQLLFLIRSSLHMKISGVDLKMDDHFFEKTCQVIPQKED